MDSEAGVWPAVMNSLMPVIAQGDGLAVCRHLVAARRRTPNGISLGGFSAKS